MIDKKLEKIKELIADKLEQASEFLAEKLEDTWDFMEPIIRSHWASANDGEIFSMFFIGVVVLIVLSPILMPVIWLEYRSVKYSRLGRGYKKRYYDHIKKTFFGGEFPVDPLNQELCFTKDGYRGALYVDTTRKQLVFVSEIHAKSFIKNKVTPEQAAKRLSIVIRFSDVENISYRNYRQEDVDSVNSVGTYTRLAMANIIDQTRGNIVFRFELNKAGNNAAYLAMSPSFEKKADEWMNSIWSLTKNNRNMA